MYDKLKSVMAERHITGYALAKKADIGNSNLYRALKGKMEMFHGWKVRIADALDCTVEELFPEKEELERLKAERKRIDEKIREL